MAGDATVKSWKTTTAGVGAFLAALGMAISTQFDGNPSTQPAWEAVAVAGFALWGLWNARDNDVSSEEAGAK